MKEVKSTNAAIMENPAAINFIIEKDRYGNASVSAIKGLNGCIFYDQEPVDW